MMTFRPLAGLALALTLATTASALARPPTATISPGYDRRLEESRRQLQPAPVPQPAPRKRHRHPHRGDIAPAAQPS